MWESVNHKREGIHSHGFNSSRGEATRGCRRINYRYYNPTDGRWTRRDPIGIEGGILEYGAFNNSPLDTNDKYGKKCTKQDVGKCDDGEIIVKIVDANDGTLWSASTDGLDILKNAIGGVSPMDAFNNILPDWLKNINKAAKMTKALRTALHELKIKGSITCCCCKKIGKKVSYEESTLYDESFVDLKKIYTDPVYFMMNVFPNELVEASQSLQKKLEDQKKLCAKQL